ncbi:MAG: TRAP transporter fused permease subunit, partial [Victivallales bacterium]|nr:TRAP transporter fused permease subunit [Victivallales bacterium]
AASTGGQIMPPIMGAAAFLMAEYMGLPYAKVALKAIIPALLYFTGIFIAVHLEAKALKLKGVSSLELPSWGYLVKNCYLVLPLGLLIWLVSTGARTMGFSAAVSIITAFVVGFIHHFFTEFALHRHDKITKTAKTSICESGINAFDALVAGSKGAITVAVACAIAGIIAGCITTTGLASILINAIVRLAGNATVIGLILTMFCCIVLGMGVPTTANYCIMASTCAPILIQLGFPAVAAHFFVFYFGIVADITPPVALAAFAGSAIAKANPMKTGLNATKLAIAAFIVPYIFAYQPVLLLENMTGNGWSIFMQTLLIVVSAMLGLFGVGAALNGHLFRPINPFIRILFAAGGLLMITPGLKTDAIGFAIIAAMVAIQRLASKKEA